MTVYRIISISSRWWQDRKNDVQYSRYYKWGAAALTALGKRIRSTFGPLISASRITLTAIG